MAYLAKFDTPESKRLQILLELKQSQHDPVVLMNLLKTARLYLTSQVQKKWALLFYSKLDDLESLKSISLSNLESDSTFSSYEEDVDNLSREVWTEFGLIGFL